MGIGAIGLLGEREGWEGYGVEVKMRCIRVEGTQLGVVS